MIREIVIGFSAGLLFGLGLALSGMTDPAVVLGFLDVAGAWNPQLVFVMAAGVPVTYLGYRFAFRHGRPLWGDRFALPTATRVDAKLVAGAALFGAGWGLAGYCPGPAIASLATGRIDIALFVIAMLLGMAITRVLASRAASRRPYAPDTPR